MKTIAIIVDENDLEIGSQDGDLLEKDAIFRVSLLWIVNDTDEVLLAQRALSKKNDPGVWGSSAAGTVEKGETYESNIRKEAEEELGLTLDELVTGPKKRMRGTYNYFYQHFIYYANPDVHSLKLQAEEVASVAWFDCNQLQASIDAKPETFGYMFGELYADVQPYLARS